MLSLLLPITLAVTVVRAAPAAMAPPPKPQAQEPVWHYCQTDLPAFGVGRVAWFNMVVDRTYKRQSASVYLKTDTFEAQWAYDGDGLAAPDGMEAFDYEVPLPPTAKFPVTVNLLFDGQLAAARIYPTPLQNALVYRDGHVEYFQSVKLTERRVPNIFGHRSMVARVVGADGRVVAENRIPLFDWAWLEKETRTAEQDAEALRKRRRCIPDS
jgi:hypothetical protein